MITNPSEDPNQSAEPKQPDTMVDLTKPIALAIADGTSAAIMRFVRVNRINVKPGSKSENPLHEFVTTFIAEFAEGPDHEEIRKKYPFADSLKAQILKAMHEMLPVAAALYQVGDIENFNRLCRVIGAGETLKFMDEHRPEIIKLIATIRGDDIIKKDDTSPVQ